ncbi:MAG: hypothetical protein U0271_00415 [Polyangiaceae bacterium]
MALHAYPTQLASFVLSRLDELGVAPLGLRGRDDGAVIEHAISIAFQASLLRDEDRPLTFRMALAPLWAFSEDGGPPMGIHRLRFSAARALTVHELKKLVTAVKFRRSIVAVAPRPDDAEGSLEIWGILHTGPRWLQVVRGGRATAPELPPVLLIHVNGPGNLFVSLGRRTLARLYAGELTIPMLDVFESAWLRGMFETTRAEVEALHRAELEAAGGRWSRADIDVVRRIGQGFIRRIISIIRAARHGGSLLFVPPDKLQQVCRASLIQVKYKFDDAEPRKRFRALILAMLRKLTTRETADVEWPAGHDGVVGWAEYASTRSVEIAELDEAIMELAELVAALADVDGLVVMTHRLEIVGFGGVVSGALPEAPRVRQALDLEGTNCIEESVDGMGTRHRAAYRIAAAVPEALAVVVSQDGSVRFVRWQDDAVTIWEQVAAALDA